MDILQLKYFCYAAECENFSRTAERFNVPTSNISQMIRRLEREIGVELFNHNRNSISLNDDGRLFYRYAKAALDSLLEANRLLTGGKDTVRGELRLFVGCNRFRVSRVIERFRQLYPDVSFSLNHHQLLNPSKYDLIIADHMEDGNYTKRSLVKEKMLFAVSNKHPLAKHDRVNLATLSNTRFITLHEESSLSKMFLRTCREAGFEPNIVIQCDDPVSVRRYVELDLGVVWYPSYSWANLFSDGVVCLEPLEPMYRESFVFWRTDRQLSRAAKLFIDCLAESFAEALE